MKRSSTQLWEEMEDTEITKLVFPLWYKTTDLAILEVNKADTPIAFPQPLNI